MTLGEKISKLRKENNYTQEQLAYILGVSRQSISKWESDITYPETDKLIRLGKLFDCSMDYLLKDACTEKSGVSKPSEAMSLFNGIFSLISRRFRERKSEKLVWGMPLYHFGRNAKGFFAVGLNARGIVAVGLKSHGVISLGALSTGILSVGLLSIGLFSLGVFCLGLASAGAIAGGVFAAGAISCGVVSFGALSVGEFSAGALAVGKYIAIGDHAYANIAVGDTEAVGGLYQHIGSIHSADISLVRDLLKESVPSLLTWAEKLFRIFVGI